MHTMIFARARDDFQKYRKNLGMKNDRLELGLSIVYVKCIPVKVII